MIFRNTDSGSTFFILIHCVKLIFIDSGGCLILEVLTYQLSMTCCLSGTWPSAMGCTKATLPWQTMKVSTGVPCLKQAVNSTLVVWKISFCEDQLE